MTRNQVKTCLQTLTNIFSVSLLFLTEAGEMNDTLSNASVRCVRDTSVTAVVFPCLYSLLFVVALVLNSLAAWIFFSIPSTSTFVVFMKNVVSDSAGAFVTSADAANDKSLTNRWWPTC